MAEFSLDFLNADSNNTISYLPFGVTTIEMSPQGNMRKGYIRPANRSVNDADKQYVGFADNTKDILVIWGAGEERGQYVRNNMTGRFFLQLVHLRNEHRKESVTLTHDGERGWKQRVFLTSAWNQKEVVRMVLGEREGSMRRITFEGEKVPTYYPRWFPPRPNEGKKIEYRKVAYPVLSAEFEEKAGNVNGPIYLYLHEGRKKKEIGNIDGDLSYARPHIELFSLLPEEGVFVIRVWLYWIHKRFPGNIFMGFEISDMNEKIAHRTFLRKRVLEIPDIERFDFVFDSKLGRITWFGTEFHYQEHWGTVEGDVAEARIAGGFDLLQKTLARIFDRAKKSKRYDVIEKLERKQRRDFKIDPKKFTPTPKYDSESIGKSYRKGLKTHVPYVKNGAVDEDLISNVVSETMQ